MPTQAIRDERDEKATMPFLSHLVELRRRIIASLLAALAGSVACFVFFDPIAGFLMAPMESLAASPSSEYLYATTVFEAFLVKFKISILAGAVLTFPIHLWNLVRFVFPGLLPKERRVVGWALAASLALVAAGFYFGYWHVIPAMLSVLTGPSLRPGRVGFLLGYDRNLTFIIQFILAMLAVFQLPLVLEVLLGLDVLKRRQVLGASRYVVVGIFVLAAVVTPSPDMVAQCMIALPLIALHFLAILVAKILRFGEGRCSE